jgi:uncharacterized protein YkwD
MPRTLAALTFAALALTGTAAGGVRTPSVASASHGIEAAAGLEQQTLAAINAVRHEQGLAPLRLNGQLAAAAREHSRLMAEHGFFDHASYNGSTFWRRIAGVYAPVKGHAWGAGENMVWSSPGLSAQAAVELWLKSPAHRKNLLAPGWREVGLGGVHAQAAPGVYQGRDVTILTADFGVR